MKARFLPTRLSTPFFTSHFFTKRGRYATLCAQGVRAILSLITASRRRSKPPPPLVAEAGLLSDSHGGSVE